MFSSASADTKEKGRSSSIKSKTSTGSSPQAYPNRSILKSKETFAGVLMHEFAHYVSGYADNTRDFENVLTEMLGFVYSELSIKGEKPKKVGLFKRW